MKGTFLDLMITEHCTTPPWSGWAVLDQHAARGADDIGGDSGDGCDATGVGPISHCTYCTIIRRIVGLRKRSIDSISQQMRCYCLCLSCLAQSKFHPPAVEHHQHIMRLRRKRFLLNLVDADWASAVACKRTLCNFVLDTDLVAFEHPSCIMNSSRCFTKKSAKWPQEKCVTQYVLL